MADLALLTNWIVTSPTRPTFFAAAKTTSRSRWSALLGGLGKGPLAVTPDIFFKNQPPRRRLMRVISWPC